MGVAEIEKIRNFMVIGMALSCGGDDDNAPGDISRHNFAHPLPVCRAGKGRAAEFCNCQHLLHLITWFAAESFRCAIL